MRLSGQKGMTLVEMIIATGIFSLLAASIFVFAVFCKTAMHEMQTNLLLTNQARQLVEKMAWGVRLAGQPNRRGIAEAVSATLPSAQQIDYVDINGTTHSVRAIGGNIEYRRGAAGAWTTLLDPNGPGVAFDAAQYSTSLQFTQVNPRAVTISLALGKTVRGRWYYASISTQVAFRNA